MAKKKLDCTVKHFKKTETAKNYRSTAQTKYRVGCWQFIHLDTSN